MPIAKSVEDTVLGEAKAGNFEDMVAIASVIDNRARQTKTTYQDVVSARDARGRQQFDAFGKALPPGVGKYRDMAKQAIAQVKTTGPVHAATFYATPSATKGLPKGLAFETKTAGHQFFTDPQNRSIHTAQGYKTPDPSLAAPPSLSAGLTNVAGQPSDTLYDVTEATAAPASLGLPDIGPAPVSRPSMAAQAAPSNPSLTGTTAFGFPTYAPTVDLEDRALSPVVGVQDYNPGAKRSLDPTAGVVEATQAAVTKSFGPGYTVGVYSGQEPAGVAAVNSKANHPDGYAIDFDVIDPQGSRVTGKNPQDAAALRGVHASLAATGRGIGYGKGYMEPGRTHVGTPPGSSVVGWGWNQSRTSMEPGLYAELSQAKTTGVSLPSFGPQVAAKEDPFSSILGTVAMPEKGPQFSPEFAAPTTTATPQAVQAAPVGPVERGTLGPAMATAPRGFTDLGVIGKTGRVGLAPESIVGPITMPTQMPRFDPVRSPIPTPAPRAPTVFAPPMVAPRAPTIAPQQAAPSATAPSMPSATAADVWGGLAQTGRATNGNQVSRNPDGSVSMTSSKYGYTEVDGQYRGIVDPETVGRVGQVGIPGPLGNVVGRTAQSQQQAPRSTGPSMRGIGPAARGVAGSVAGSVLGGMFGPLGAVFGATIGRNLATGKTALGKFQDFGRMTMPTPTQARSAFAQGFTPGLGFPTAPTGNASQGGLTSFGQEASRGDHGGQAQSAANSPGRGLY